MKIIVAECFVFVTHIYVYDQCDTEIKSEPKGVAMALGRP